MNKNYELHELYECFRMNLAAKAANVYEYSYHLRRSRKTQFVENLFHS